jgi:hypothetical protein
MRRVHAKDFACRVSVQRLTISGDRLSCRKQEAPHRDNKLASVSDRHCDPHAGDLYVFRAAPSTFCRGVA